MAPIPGSVRVTGDIAPSDTVDTYATHDAIYGRDGLRSVADAAARNAVTTDRRREGMLVYQQDTGVYYRLLPAPWTGTNSDWVDSGIGSSGAITTGKTLWVDATFGDDGTGLTQRQDKPFATIAAAVAAAASGDLVLVRPGAYTVAATLYKAGVSIYFEQGATVSYTATVIDDTAAPGGTFRILGYGAFTASGADRQLISIGGATVCTFICESIVLGSGTAANSPVTAAFLSSNGSLLLRARTITSARSTQPAIFLSPVGVSGTLILDVAESITTSGTGGALQIGTGTAYVNCPVWTCASSGTAVSVTGGTLYLTASSITVSAGGALSVTGGTVYGRVASSILVNAGTSSALAMSGAANVTLSCTLLQAADANVVAVTAGTLALVCTGITAIGATRSAVAVAAGTVAISCSGVITGLTAGVQISGGTCAVQADTITGTSAAVVLSAGTLTARSRVTTASAGRAVNVTGGTVHLDLGTLSSTTGNLLSATGGEFACDAITCTDVVNAALGITAASAVAISIRGNVTASAVALNCASSTVRGSVAGNLAGTGGGLVASGGTVALNVEGNISSTGPATVGVSVQGSASLNLSGNPSISGAGAGVDMAGNGTAVIEANAVTGTAGPGARQTGVGFLILHAQATILGTTFGLQITNGLATVRARVVSASAGIAVSLAIPAVLNLTADSVTASGTGVSVTGGTLTGAVGSITSTGGTAVGLSGGTVRLAVQGNIITTGGTGQALALSGAIDLQLSCAAMTCPGASVFTMSGGTAIVSCTGITCVEAASDAVTVSGGTLILTCSDTIAGQISGIQASGSSVVDVKARKVTSVPTWRALWVSSGAAQLTVVAQEIVGGSRAIQIDSDATVRLTAALIQATDGGSIAVDCDSAAATLVIDTDNLLGAGDGVFVQAGTARINAKRIVAATNALRANNGGGGPIVTLEANVTDLVQSTTTTAISVLCERFILGGSAEIRAVAMCASCAISGGEKATLKCGSMTATGVGSACIVSTADGDVDVLVDGPLIADLRGVLHTGAGDLTVRCASISVTSATARAIDASGDTGSSLSVVVAGNVTSHNSALYMDTAALTEQVSVEVGGSMLGRTRVVDVLANGILNLTAAAIEAESGQNGIGIRLEAIDNWELIAHLKVGTVTGRGAANAGLVLDNSQAYVQINTLTSTDDTGLTMDNGADLTGTIDNVYGQGTAGTGRAITLANGSSAQLNFRTLSGSSDSEGINITGVSSSIAMDGDGIESGLSSIFMNGGNVRGRVGSLFSFTASGLEVVAGTFALTVNDITANPCVVLTSTGGGSLRVNGTLLSLGQVAISITAGASNTDDGLLVQGGSLRGGLGVVTRGIAAYRVELRGVRIVSASTPGHCIDLDGSGDFIIAGCQLVTPAGATNAVEGNGNLKVYSGCVATKPVVGTVTELVDTVLVSADVT